MKKVLLICLTMAVFLFFAGCQKANTRSMEIPSSPSPADTDNGVLFLKKGDYRQSIDACKTAIEKDPNVRKEIFLHLAYAYFLNEQPDEAKEMLSRWKGKPDADGGKTQKKSEEDRLKEKFIVCMVEGKYDDALKEAEKAEKARGVSSSVEKGFAYFYQGNLNRAGEIFEDLEENRQANEWDRETAGKMVDKIEKMEKSGKSVSSPDTINSASHRAEQKKKSVFKKRRATSSLFTPIPAEKTVKGSDNALLKKGDVFFTVGKFEKALECYLEALEENPKNDDAYVRTGDIYLRTGQYQKSGEAFKKALKVNPRNKYAHFGYADILMENGNHTDAEKQLKKSLEIDGNFAVAYTTIGDIYVDRGDFKNAEKAFLKSLEVDPLQKYPDTYIGLGELYFKKDELEKSLQYFKKAQEKDPFDKDVFLGAAKTLIRMERYEEAESNFEKALKLVPGDLDLGTEYIGFCIGTKRFVKAEELLNVFLKKYPDEEDLLKLKEKLEEEKK